MIGVWRGLSVRATSVRRVWVISLCGAHGARRRRAAGRGGRQFHFTKEPLIEEYGMAKQARDNVWSQCVRTIVGSTRDQGWGGSECIHKF